MANLVNTSGFRSAAAASGAPALRLDAVDYDMINRGFAEGMAEGKKLLDDLRDLEIAPAVQEVKKKQLALQSGVLDRSQQVANGELAPVTENGDWFVDSTTGQPIQRKAAPTADSIIVEKNGALVQQRYSTDPYTLERKLLDEVEIMPANPAAPSGAPATGSAPEGSASDPDPDPLDFSAEHPAQVAGAGAAPTYGVRSIGPKGLVLGVQRPRATGTKASGAGADSYAKQADNDYLKDAAEAATTAQKVLPKLQTFAQLNKETASGPLVGAKPVAWVRSIFNNDVATLNALTNDFAKLAREGFPGSVSNAEMNLFRSAGPSISNPDKTNATLVSVMMPLYQRGAEKYGMAREWVARNNSLDGFDSLWNQYINEVPTVPKAVLDRAASGKKEDVAAALDLLANTPAQPRVGFKDFVALKRFGRVPAADVQTLSNKGARILVGPDGQLKSPDTLRQEVEQSIRAKYPSAPSSEDNPRAAANYDAATEAIIQNASRAGLNSAVDAAVQPAPAPAAAPADKKTIGDVLDKGIDSKRASKTLPQGIGLTATDPATGLAYTPVDDPRTANTPLPDKIASIQSASRVSRGEGDGETVGDGYQESMGGIPNPFKRKKTLLHRAIDAIPGAPETPSYATEEPSDDFVQFVSDNKEKILKDPKFRAKVNFAVREAVAAYTPQSFEGQRWYEGPAGKLDQKATRRLRANLWVALRKAKLDGIVRIPTFAGDTSAVATAPDPLGFEVAAQ